jgi:hypothetical protein
VQKGFRRETDVLEEEVARSTVIQRLDPLNGTLRRVDDGYIGSRLPRDDLTLADVVGACAISRV